jgi:hypothetical protein
MPKPFGSGSGSPRKCGLKISNSVSKTNLYYLDELHQIQNLDILTNLDQGGKWREEVRREEERKRRTGEMARYD